MELPVIILLFALTVILTVYNHSQAAALHGVKAMAEDFLAMQIRDRRNTAATDVSLPNPTAWLERKVNPKLPRTISIQNLSRAIPEINALEFVLKDGGRLVVTTASVNDIRNFQQRQKVALSKAASRVSEAVTRSIIPTGWFARYQVVELAMSSEGVVFDIEAGVFSKHFGVNWGEPDRLQVILLNK